MRVFNGVDEFAAAVGEHLGYSEWHEITQPQVDQFAEATGDHQWIHVDPERARTGPFGTTIAHGYLTLSLIPTLGKEIYRVDGIALGINYGTNKVRFPQPVPVGARVRAGMQLAEVADSGKGKRFSCTYTIEIEGKEKPACIAETVVVLVPAD
ncbi:acyl dehydratase [Tamaricihabitans halophyticus]|uniref:Acyl dehydratase n=1 Tax=Tamaricihabitans halophyticus TaxID=1262583 RepID=A0A4R2QL78_9PSEU|nr:MaoC family dehydratase [Tamaricihabitans halophyticus]TCP50107.1 acyl dehydratase [Tamaricihabitans halophyticus]